MSWAGPPGKSGDLKKHRYICTECGYLFDFPLKKSDSKLINILKASCPNCGSYELELTEFGKLLWERQQKLSKLNKISES